MTKFNGKNKVERFFSTPYRMYDKIFHVKLAYQRVGAAGVRSWREHVPAPPPPRHLYLPPPTPTARAHRRRLHRVITARV
ncbi:hypothetical protein EVAR_29402_1 [Eumeta japonica]|uniref:Uncharacterized protein n=1 Tax=Eumeta variegata TaxID=151549 RepID=A0A4C1VW20_EUMVA|nr:hypothetical protein EVAR_29402_1 [Eumeta japonica]